MNYSNPTDVLQPKADDSDIEEKNEESDIEGNIDESDIEAESDVEDKNESDVDESDIEDLDESELAGGVTKGISKGGAGASKGASTSTGTGAGAGASKKESGNDESSSDSSDESSSESSDDDDYLQKFNQKLRDDLIMKFHPESKSHNYDEIKQLAKVSRNKNGIIVDELHKTIPILTKYEKTRILGQRAKQIESGATVLVQVPPNVIDSYLIAKLELAQQKIPFIIRRPLPNGGMEYWYVSDLEDV